MVSDIPAGDGKMYNIFLQCRETTQYTQYPHVDAYQPQYVPYGRAGNDACLDDCKNRIPKGLKTDKGSKSVSDAHLKVVCNKQQVGSGRWHTSAIGLGP